MMPKFIGVRQLAELLKKRQEKAVTSFRANLRSHGALYLRLMRMTPRHTLRYKGYTLMCHADGTYSVGGRGGHILSSHQTAMKTANFLFPEGEYVSTLHEETR